MEPGEKLVIGGHEKLKDGMEVRVAEPAKGQPKGGATTSAPATKGGGAL